MAALAVRGLLSRRLRSALTAIAILLGVAMISGTYVLTDQIRTAFEDIEKTANQGVDVQILPREEFTGSFSEPATVPESVVERVRAVSGVGRAEGQVIGTGSLVVDGKHVEPNANAPVIVASVMSDPFNPTRAVEGRQPRRPGEISLLKENAEDEDIRLGQRIGLATRTGVKPVTVVGFVQYGDVSSVGGATLIITTLADAQRWFELEGRVSDIAVAAAPGVSPQQLVRRIGPVLPRTLQAKTGEQDAADEAKEVNDQIGSFLTPALLTFAGAALLVGAFIIFNTFTTTVAQRAKEFGVLRTLGASRRQILLTVAGEALVLGLVASVLGLLAGLAFAKLIGALFDAAGFGIPTGDLTLAPRTIVLALIVGLGVTLVSALGPALRATRVPPVAALRDDVQIAHGRWARLAPYVGVGVMLLGVVLLCLGLFGGGTATSRLATMGGGAVLVFVGVGLTARYVVRPLAGALGWPVERLFGQPGRIARENAMRNPRRTAATSAALMVGLGLVVFVAVFANSLKSSFTETIDSRITADLMVRSDTNQPVPAKALPALRADQDVRTASPLFFEQIEVNGKKSSAQTDALQGVDPTTFGSVYDVDWLEGDDALLGTLLDDAVVAEEQFAEAHGLKVGSRFRVVTPSGGRASLRVTGIYRDPTLLQGAVINRRSLAAISPTRDPFIVFVDGRDGIDPEAFKASVERAMKPFPIADVQSGDDVRDAIEEQLNQIVYLLYALLAMSILISLFGIANSLFLSIHERTREFGLLRAVGATQRQVREIVRLESVITAVIGGVLGAAIGLVFGWLMILALSEWGLGFSLPFGQVLVWLVVAGLVGVAGAALPARRGARLKVLDALHRE